MAALPLRFVQSAAQADQVPPARAEIAVVGRSNVGKSSLLNALSGRKDLARTSKTPGATRLLNVFEVATDPPGRFVVDLPGYGYAKVPATERRRWQGMIEGYLIGRPTLVSALVLIDAEVGPTELDLSTIEWLDHIDLDRRYVATKSDKVRSSRRPARKRELLGRLGVAGSEVAWVSAAKGHGIVELARLISDDLAGG